MRMLFAAGILLGALCLPAKADWQYTKWGMSTNEIIAASKKEARRFKQGDDIVCTFTNQKILAVIPRKTIGSRTFKVAFCSFGDDRLGAVSLSTTDNYHLIKNDLLSNYGKPVSDNRDGTVWNSPKTGNTITLIDIAGIAARIEYKRIGGGGL